MKKKTILTIVTMTLIGLLVVIFYQYQTSRTDVPEDTAVEDLSQIDVLLQKDLKTNYPATAKEVVDYYSRMSQVIYTGVTDEEIEKVAFKMRELFDEELLEKNSPDEHLIKIKGEIAAFTALKRKIRVFEIKEASKVEKNPTDDLEYTQMNVVFRMNDDQGIHSVVHRYVLRKNSNDQWKILGWTLVETEND